MKVVSFYTKDTNYESYANNLRDSMDKHKVSYKIYEVDNLGKWELNCGQKPMIIKWALECTDDDIFYVDSDALFKRQPDWEVFEKQQVPSFAWFEWADKSKIELLSGSIFFPNNQLSKLIVDMWIVEQEKTPEEWDQRVLERLVKENNIPHEKLPLEWVKVEDYMKWVSQPYIQHYQASRTEKRKINNQNPINGVPL